MDRGWLPSYLAALVVGTLVLVAFFVWHWFSIAPIWRVLVEGAVGVALAAAAIAWAWRLSRRAGRFRGRAGGLAFGAVFAGAIVVCEAVGLARGPTPDPTTLPEIAAALPLPLVPVALAGLAGWRLARGWRGAVAFTLAALVLVLYLGGSIVQRGGVGIASQLFALLFVCYLAGGAALAALEPRFRGVLGPADRPDPDATRSDGS